MRRDRRSARLAAAAIEALESRRLLAQSVWAYPGADGHLLYRPQPLGDHIQDYSTVGYMGNLAPIPDVPVKATVSPVAGDDTSTIQAAINAVATLPQDANGFRGAVLLNPGTYEVGTQLSITASGVVLRGSGQAQTLIHATGTGQRSIIQLNGSGTRTTVSGTTHTITDKYVPVGAISFTVDSTAGLAVGDTVVVHRPSTQQWINDMGMNLLTNPWTPGSKDINMDRTITHIDGNVITVDAPMTQALELKYTDASQGNNTIYKYTASGRVANVGVEHLGGYSDYNPAVTDPNDGFVDEDHPWIFINIDGVLNGWAHNVTSQFFGYACVTVTGNSKYVTVQDSQCLDPVSQITGGRRYSFLDDDAVDVLFRNLYTREGRHDYVEGSTVAGPNVFVDSRADATHADIGPHHRYSTAALWDNVRGGSINIQDRGNSGTGHGHAGANQVIWNSIAGSFIVQSPIAAQNWLIGSVGTVSAGGGVGFHTPGLIDSSGPSGTGARVDIKSLYYQQLAERTAYENFTLREARVGDNDAFVNNGASDNVAIDAAWKSAIELTTGKTSVGFDTAANNQLVPMTFNFPIDAGTYVVGANLQLGVKSGGGSTAGDLIYVENTGRTYTWAELGVTAPATTEAGVAIDLSKLIPAMQDGKLNIAILGNTGVDWATLNLQTASTTQPTTSAITPAADAYVQDGTNAGTNFGTATTLQTKLDTVNNNRDSYLKFDLSSFANTPVTKAYVRLMPTSVGYAANTFASGTGAIFNQVSFVPDDTWTETGINYTNKPASNPYFREFVSYANEYVTVDVTSLVQAALAGDKKMSLRLQSIVNSSAGQISYGSRENSDATLRPQLFITTFNNALTPVADAYVRSGASANLNFGTATDLESKMDNAGRTGDNNRDSFLKWDLSSLGTAPAGATVRLIPTFLNANVPTAGDFVSTDSWTETGITWNTKPALTTAISGETPFQATPVKWNLTSQVASTISGDDLLSFHAGTNTVNTGVNYFGARENADGTLAPLLILKNLGPQITSIKNLAGSINTATPATWFGIWDAETAASSLLVSATSSNTTLLPNANIAFGGSGMDRTFTLAPASGQTGTTTVTLTVTDGNGATAVATFQYNVTSTVNIDGDQDFPNENDIIRIVRSGTFLDVIRNGVTALHADYATAPTLAIHALGGNDQLIIDLTGGTPISAAGVTLDGGAASDVVSVTGTSGADSVSLSGGSVVVSSLAAAITGAEELDLNLAAGADTLTAGGNGSVNTGLLVLNIISGETLSMGTSSTLPDVTDVVIGSGGTFNINGQNQTIDALSGAGTVNNTGASAATLTVGQQGSSFSFSGTLANGSSALSLTKVGAGKLTMSGANSYTGTTTIAGGIIESGNSASLAGLSGAVLFNGGTFHVTANTISANVANKYSTSFTGATSSSTATFDIDAGVTLTIGTVGGSANMRTNGGGAHGGTFTKTGAGTLRILSNNGQLDDPFKLNQGTVIVESATGLGGADNASNHVDMKSGTTLILKQDAATNFLTPINVVDAGGSVNVVLDRQTTGAGVAHSVNAITSVGAFTMNISAGSNVTSGTVGLNIGAITLSGVGTFNVGANALLTVTGAVSGAFGLTKSGAGTLKLQNSLITSPTISIAGGVLALASGGTRIVKTSGLAITGGGQLDLADNKLVVAGGQLGSVSGGVYSGLSGLIQSGLNGGTWNGPGIITSMPEALAAETTLAAATAEQAGYVGGNFGGVPVAAGDVLVMYTYAGDANLDGVIDPDDYAQIDFTDPNPSAFGYFNGDFNYDGEINADDYALIDFNFHNQGAPFPT